MKNQTIHDIFFSMIDFLQFKILIFSLSASTMIAMISQFIKIYVFDDFDFLFILGVLLIMDMTSGIIKAVVKDGKKVSASKFIRIGIKFFNCMMILVSIHILQNYASPEGIGQEFFQTVGRSTCIIYFLSSIIPNIYILSDKKLPIGWLMKIIESAETKLNSPEIDKNETKN